MNSAKIEAKTNSKFMVRLGWNDSEITDALGRVNRDNSSKKSAVYKWITCFKNGRDDVKDDSRSRKPATSVLRKKSMVFTPYLEKIDYLQQKQ